jgi:predicted DCC family thiol-disulfide oxidoreductase YuxK
MPPISSFTILYDAECGLCTSAKDWIERQAPLVGLHFVATGSPEARKRFPQLHAGELAVVSDLGEVWIGDHAWIVCLWALRDYRDFAFKLTSPLLSLLAREAFAVVSKNRLAVSSMLRLRNEREMEQQLRKVVVPRCQIEPQHEQK